MSVVGLSDLSKQLQ